MRVFGAAAEVQRITRVRPMEVEKALRKAVMRKGAAHLTLIDPAKQSPEEAAQMALDAHRAGTDGLMVGGSTRAGGKLLDRTIQEIKGTTGLPVILFPASEAGVSKHADAIFFMSMLNSRNPYFITGAQRRGAPLVKKFGLETLPMAYLLVEPGGAAGRVGKADLIPRSAPELAVSYALAAQFLGMRFVYLEAGSGAEHPVPPRMVRAVRRATDLVLIVGGGIRTAGAAAERIRAGADILVTGTLVERAQDRITELKKVIEAVRRAGKEKITS
jgi:phosphoglycerol geranylgeranyltransferase